MTNLDTAQEETEDRFYAQFDSREVELMTLDELAAAFEEGRIHGNTFVCREGEGEWATLSEVAGLDDEPEPEPAPSVIVERRPPMPERTVRIAAETRPPMPESRSLSPEQRPPLSTLPAARFASVAPSLAPTVASSSRSFAPVSRNIDETDGSLDGEESLRPRRRWSRALLVAATLMVVGGGAVFALGGGTRAMKLAPPGATTLRDSSNESHASLPLPPESKAPEPAVPAAVVPAPVAAVAPSPAESAATAPGLSENMKAALLAHDKVHPRKHPAKVKARVASGRGVARHAKLPSSAGLKSGGSAYDPLNGKL